MRLVHLSDLHLGYRQYQRLTPLGVNQREADVARSFEYVVGKTIELRPDMVLIAGDVFHHVRPTNKAILHAFRQFERLQRELPDAEIVLVSGNHDTPRAAETGSILRLFSSPTLHVVETEPQRLSFPEWDLSLLAVPDCTRGLRHSLTPDSSSRYNILLLHGAIEGMLPAHLVTEEYAATEISPDELRASEWNYVALGHYHVYREIAPNEFYSGSIDYTSVNAWGEKIEEKQSGIRGKGFIEYDLATGTHRFHDIPPSRPLIDLPVVQAKGLTAAEVDERIATAVGSVPGGIDDKIVRLIVRDLPRHIGRELDHKALREYKRRALHFQLDPRRPELVRSIGQGAPGRRPSLAEVVREKLATRDIEPDIDRGSLVELGLRYLKEAEGAAVPSAMAVEE